MTIREQSTRRSVVTLPDQLSEYQRYYLALLHSLPIKGSGGSKSISTLGITSCNRGEGVSTVAAQLSMAAAFTGMRVLLVDFSWKHPAVHQLFNVPCSPGASDVLALDGPNDNLIQPSHISNLDLLTAGTQAGNLNPERSFEKIRSLIDSLRSNYDLTIFDLPEATKAGTSLALASVLDGVVFVVEAERVRWEVASRVQELLLRSGANVLGVVLNKRRFHIPNWLYRTL